ncbi:hypothetical protein AAY473_029660 [Plecturocebus cupreus]
MEGEEEEEEMEGEEEEEEMEGEEEEEEMEGGRGGRGDGGGKRRKRRWRGEEEEEEMEGEEEEEEMEGEEEEEEMEGEEEEEEMEEEKGEEVGGRRKKRRGAEGEGGGREKEGKRRGRGRAAALWPGSGHYGTETPSREPQATRGSSAPRSCSDPQHRRAKESRLVGDGATPRGILSELWACGAGRCGALKPSRRAAGNRGETRPGWASLRRLLVAASCSAAGAAQSAGPRDANENDGHKDASPFAVKCHDRPSFPSFPAEMESGLEGFVQI